jgi:hypothetical protein
MGLRIRAFDVTRIYSVSCEVEIVGNENYCNVNPSNRSPCYMEFVQSPGQRP